MTAPSSGVPADLRPRLDACVADLQRRGYEVVSGDCLDGEGVVSAPAAQRADELVDMLLDPQVRAVVPPWGGELLVECCPTSTSRRSGALRAQGRLVGGCAETVSILAGTAYGDLPSFAREHAPEGLLVHVEASGDVATDIARDLWRMRLAGWFGAANAVLVGRTTAPDADGTQLDAVRSVLGLPVVLDVDCGHVAPHLALVNGALAEVDGDGDGSRRRWSERPGGRQRARSWWSKSIAE